MSKKSTIDLIAISFVSRRSEDDVNDQELHDRLIGTPIALTETPVQPRSSSSASSSSTSSSVVSSLRRWFCRRSPSILSTRSFGRPPTTQRHSHNSYTDSEDEINETFETPRRLVRRNSLYDTTAGNESLNGPSPQPQQPLAEQQRGKTLPLDATFIARAACNNSAVAHDADGDLYFSKRFFVVFAVEQPAVLSTVDVTSSDSYLELPRYWINLDNLLRIAYGRMAGSYGGIHGRDNKSPPLPQSEHVISLRSLLHRRRFDLSLIRKTQYQGLSEDQLFVDEFFAFQLIFSAAAQPANAKRRGICAQLAKWLHVTVRCLNQKQRSKNLQLWERSVYSAMLDQIQLNNILQEQLRKTNDQQTVLKAKYETLLRLNKPTKTFSKT